ncbi:unnamed protein product [Ilex paraguariensis]|uniref:Uncharacterized protein n=1 Tax=Ilex paraguariensis TaxID=185542 RepID=A0ABC8SCS2_9AQUA
MACQVESAFGEFVFRELSAMLGAITITCLMVANLVGFVIGPSGIHWLISGFLQEEGFCCSKAWLLDTARSDPQHWILMIEVIKICTLSISTEGNVAVELMVVARCRPCIFARLTVAVDIL